MSAHGGAPGSLVGTGWAMPRDDRATMRGHPEVRPPWSRSERPIPRRILRPLQAFLETEAAGAVLLLAATLVALAWANSPWRELYERLWHVRVNVRVGAWQVSHDLRHWVNEGLMTLFFLVVGLEIKRELLTGELRGARAAVAPVVAAVGGMLGPALVYLALNPSGEAARGWGIPMATDIAFALGLLGLAAGRAAGQLKPFLLTLAIVDDIGAIVVIALFYSGRVDLPALASAAALCGLIALLRRIGVRAGPVYLLVGMLVWAATAGSGLHPTIAGVALGLLTPAVAFQRPRAVSEEAHRVADETVDEPVPPDADAHHWLYLAALAREAVSPLARLEALLHPWTSLVIVPLFALANAGVELSAEDLAAAARSPVALGVFLGLVAGKLVGVSAGALAASRLAGAPLPAGAGLRGLLGAAQVAGIGFTVSLFVADLAFGDPGLRDVAKVAILAASVAAALLAAAILRGARR